MQICILCYNFKIVLYNLHLILINYKLLYKTPRYTMTNLKLKLDVRHIHLYLMKLSYEKIEHLKSFGIWSLQYIKHNVLEHIII